jgi:hypothetical protein
VKKTFFALGLVAVACLAIFLFCSKNSTSSSTGPGNATPPVIPDQVMSYTISGNNIITLSTLKIDTLKSCNGSVMTTRYDTVSKPGYDTVAYVLTSNTLIVLGVNGGDSGSFTNPAAKVVYDQVFTRQGTGTDLIGSWKSTGRQYRLVSGTLTSAERQQLDSAMVADAAQMAVGNYTELSITADKINVYQHGIINNSSWADYFIAGWNNQQLDSITITKINDSSVRLVGRTSGETVTITNSTDGITYTSSNSAHAAYTYYNNPTTCPNDYYPSWFWLFLAANPKAAAKVTPDQLMMLGENLAKPKTVIGSIFSR